MVSFKPEFRLTSDNLYLSLIDSEIIKYENLGVNNIDEIMNELINKI